MASDQGSPGLKLSSKRARLCSNYEKCIKCQTIKKNEKLQTAMQSSIAKFIECAKLRNDEIFRRIEPDLTNNALLVGTVKWHKSCYSAYTSNENVKYQATTQPEALVPEPSASVTLRSSATATNWSLCFVCQQGKCKGERDLTQVVTMQVYDTLMHAAEYRSDEKMMTKIRGEDLVAIEAKYHRGCYQRYTVVASSSKSNDGTEGILAEYDRAFLKLINEVGHKMYVEGRAYDMATLLSMYKHHLADSGIDKAAVDMYKVKNLKRRLIHKYGEKIAFHPQYERNKAELVCSSSLNLGEVINLVEELKEMTKDSRNAPKETDTCAQVLYHAAVILRSDMKDSVGIETLPLNVSDVSAEKAKEIVPARLQQFLRWLMQSQRSFEGEQQPIEDLSDWDECGLKEAETRNVLAIGQDIVSCNSGGRKKMPKNVGLGLAIKTMVRGKEIIKMLNHHGHSINYWECEQIDTKWAELSLNQFEDGGGYYQAILPSNIAIGTFVQSAADNADYVQDTLDGRTVYT